MGRGRWLWCFSICLLVGPGLAEGKPAKRKPKKPRTVAQADAGKSPNSRYGAMTKAECLAELRRRNVKFAPIDAARGVLAPVRLKGPLGGVTWRTEAPAEDRAASPNEIYDCRLVLALSDWSEILARHEVEEVHIFSAWRTPPKSWPADKPATRHPGALAVDVRRLVKKKKAADAKARDLVVLRDWAPKRDVPPCEGLPSPDTPEAAELRAMFCEADQRKIFTVMLSPNYDKAHENHFHLEVTPRVKWRLVL
jgi:hypothetical protein